MSVLTSPVQLQEGTQSPFAEPPPRLLGKVGSGAPTLICTGGLHGNEPAGVLGLQQVLAALERSTMGMMGTFVAFSGNRRALVEGRRYLEMDLNRSWVRRNLAKVRAAEGHLRAEEEELRELDRELGLALEAAGKQVALMDIHTTSGPGPAFINLDDTLPNRALAMQVPVPLVVGIEEELEGTLTHMLTDLGLPNLGFEAGRHEDPVSVDRAAAAVWLTLESSGVLARGSRPEVAEARRFLSRETGELPRVVEVRYRHAILPEDEFRMLPGYVSLQSITKGEHLAEDRQGAVLSPAEGRILMPLYQRQGDEGFFLVQPIRPTWLRISALVRRWHLERFLHWLPGVRRHPEMPGSFRVDRRYARWGSLELFHLLGFRRIGPKERRVVMTRRPDPPA